MLLMLRITAALNSAKMAQNPLNKAHPKAVRQKDKCIPMKTTATQCHTSDRSPQSLLSLAPKAGKMKTGHGMSHPSMKGPNGHYAKAVMPTINATIKIKGL